MKEYLKKNGIRLAVVLALLVVALSVAAGTSSGRAGFLTNAVGAVREPVRKAAASLSDWITGFAGYFGEYDALLQENAELRAELAETLEQAQAYSEEADENARLRQALGLEQRGSEYTLESAKIVTWNASNWKSSFTISKGESSGIGYGDCVVTEYGAVVGTVSELGRGWATGSTVVDARCALGALVGVDRYAAQLQGDFVLMRRGEVYLSGYPAGAAIEPGDEVLTSGSEGVVPQGANIGTVSAVNDDGSVVVAPAADLDSLVQVFVIKEFSVEE